MTEEAKRPAEQPGEQTEEAAMNNAAATSTDTEGDEQLGALLLGTGLALASLILLPAIAQKLGLGASMTIALRGALMRASQRI
jgi:hypothetical protein